jgi:hypothetical protein
MSTLSGEVERTDMPGKSLRTKELAQEDIDALRQAAGMPLRSDSVNVSGVKSRIVEVIRDSNGNVVSSIERIEETLLFDRSLNWLE